MSMKLPEYMIQQYGSARKFRQEKRRQAQAIKSALMDFQTGCAFTPRSEFIVGIVRRQLDDLIKQLSVRRWGR